MRLILIASAFALVLPALAAPGLAAAEEAAAPAEQPAKPPRKICRSEPSATGSNRPGKRICRTAQEWKMIDRGEADIDMSGGTPTRSQGNRQD